MDLDSPRPRPKSKDQSPSADDRTSAGLVASRPCTKAHSPPAADFSQSMANGLWALVVGQADCGLQPVGGEWTLGSGLWSLARLPNVLPSGCRKWAPGRLCLETHRGIAGAGGGARLADAVGERPPDLPECIRVRPIVGR